MRVLVACEFSGIVREAFSKKGHDATSCDLMDSEIPGNHYTGDVTDLLKKTWDLIIAHPPCTYICQSGVRHLHTERGRIKKMEKAVDFFNIFLDHPCEKIAVENPIPHNLAMLRLRSRYSQIIHPYWFGHPESKSTCLWLKGLPRIRETDNVKEKMMSLPSPLRNKIHHMSPGIDRAKNRSRTYQGIANAMADQWSQ